MSVLGKRGAPPPYSFEAPSTAAAAQTLKIVIGVDFGTTGTGISYVTTEGAHVKTLDDVHSVDDWPNPGRVGDFTSKTPSRLAYAKDNTRISVNAYGHEVKPEDTSYSWMKLLLDPELASKYDDPSLTASEGAGVLKLPINKKAWELCGDYLTEVCKLAFKSIAKKISIENLQSMPAEFWFTVPAVWSDKAKADTLRAARVAARQAGIKLHRDSQIFLIREPEAAAIATLSATVQGRSDSQVKVGDSVLVADCGGGTVDTTSYEITSISPTLEFKELIVGTGGKCGSTFIDRNLHSFMEKKFGAAYISLPWQKKGPASRFMKEFEGHKRDFGKSNDPTTYYELQLVMKRVKGSKHYDSDENIVKIYQEDMKKMFDPVVKMIISLLDSQLETERKQSGKVTIKTLLLVGGFGDSTYLMDEVRAWCSQHDIRAICPKDPQSAIVRGAALSGVLKIQPSSRRSRFHYGWDFHEAYDPMRHRLEDRFVWDWDGKYRARNQMGWELSKGDLVDQNTNIKFSFNYTIDQNNARGSNECALFSCSLDEAPVNTKDPGVKKIATIKLDFSNVDLSGKATKMVKRKRMCSIPAEVVIQFGHRRGVLTFSCSVDGKEIGQTELDFDGQSNVDAAEGIGMGAGAYGPTCTPQ